MNALIHPCPPEPKTLTFPRSTLRADAITTFCPNCASVTFYCYSHTADGYDWYRCECGYKVRKAAEAAR